MNLSRINKIYLSNFLTGLVFWYGIEKLFMRSIGISAVGIGIATAIVAVVLVVFDIPGGLLADKWSRKGTLAVSALCLAGCSLVSGISSSLQIYVIGSMLYALYLVTSNGTYQALIYDTLHEAGESASYSRVNGKAFALFLVGAGVGNVAGGFIGSRFGLRVPFLISIVPSLLNVVVIASMYEPTFHKAIGQERILRQLKKASAVVVRTSSLRAFALILTMLAVIELFKLDFAQLYMLRYFSAPQVIGILWAIYAFAMAFGSFIAHRLRARLDVLVAGATVPIILMAFIDNWLSIALFMVQAVAAAALINQIDAKIQDSVPSTVRASIFSTISTLGRIISIPASLVLGYVFRYYDALLAVRLIALVAGVILVYWLLVRRRAYATE